MSFNSSHFLFFLPCAVIGYYLLLERGRLRECFLLVANYYYYLALGIEFGAILALITIVTYFVGLRLDSGGNSRERKGVLGIGLLASLGVLATFKYVNFAVGSFVSIVSILGMNIAVPNFAILAPIGISFYTFQSASYCIDVYRKRVPAEKDFIKFALFLSFFPQLLAGPIVRAPILLPQLHGKPAVSDARFLNGMLLIFKGLFKKVVLADLIGALAVNRVFGSPQSYSTLDLIFTLYGYAFQIYNDFSGYTDIAIGVGFLFGLELPQNFDRPYLSSSIREFWRRWHMTLSSWFRDYLYIPLGGNRGARGRVSMNLLITMVLCGLWHGPSFNFVLWGGYNGLLLVAGHWFESKELQTTRLGHYSRVLLTFHVVVLGWLLFRSESLTAVTEYLKALSKGGLDVNVSLGYLAIVGIAALLHVTPKRWCASIEQKYVSLPIVVQGSAYALFVAALGGLVVDTPNFIYFQF